MMKKSILSVIILLLLAGAVFCLFRPESEADKVKKVLRTLCRMATKTPGENAAAAALMISKTDKIFADNFHISISNGMFNGSFNPTKMTSELARYRAVFKNVKVEAQDMEVSFPAPNQAQLVFSGILNGDTKTGHTISEARDVICLLEKAPKGWLIKKMEIREIMEK